MDRNCKDYDLMRIIVHCNKCKEDTKITRGSKPKEVSTTNIKDHYQGSHEPKWIEIMEKHYPDHPDLKLVKGQKTLDFKPAPKVVSSNGIRLLLVRNGDMKQTDTDKLKQSMINWCMIENIPLSKLRADSFQDMIETALHITSLEKLDYSKDGIVEDIKLLTSQLESKLVELFKIELDYCSISVDGWESPQKVTFLCIRVHWKDKRGGTHSILIGFEHLTESHTGLYMAKVVLKVLKRFGLENKLVAIVGDSAQSNIKMAKDLRTLLNAVKVDGE